MSAFGDDLWKVWTHSAVSPTRLNKPWAPDPYWNEMEHHRW